MADRQEVHSSSSSLGRLILRRTLLGIALILLILVPSLILFAVTGQPVATYAAMGTLCGAVAVMSGGVRIGVIASIVLGLVAPLAVVAGLSPVSGAALMALMTLMVGRMSLFGLHGAVMLIPIIVAWPMLTPMPWLPREILDKVNELLTKHGMTLADAIDKASGHPASSSGSPSAAGEVMAHLLRDQRMDAGYLLWIAAFFFIGSIIPVMILPLVTRKMHKPAPATHTRREAVPYTITITVLATAGTYFFLANPKMTGGSFFIATILVLTQIGTHIKWKLTLQRVLGTIGGAVLMFVIILLMGKTVYIDMFGVPIPGWLYLIGLIFGTLAIISKFSPRQWIYYIMIVPTTACLNAFTFTQAGTLNEQRLVDNVVGAALVIVAAGATLVATRIAEKRGEVKTPFVA